MFKFRTTASGFWSFTKSKKKDDVVNRAATAAIKTALVDYVTGKLADAKLVDRFKPSAYARYGFAGRSPGYMKRARAPYVSPRSVNLTRIAQVTADLANGKGNALALIRAMQHALKPINAPHMRDLMRRPGGYVLRVTGKRKATASVRYPGARILNRAGPNSAIYRKQLVDLGMGGRHDLLAILSRMNEVYDDILGDYIANSRKQKVAA